MPRSDTPKLSVQVPLEALLMQVNSCGERATDIRDADEDIEIIIEQAEQSHVMA
jgi:hypothetical protein